VQTVVLPGGGVTTVVLLGGVGLLLFKEMQPVRTNGSSSMANQDRCIITSP